MLAYPVERRNSGKNQNTRGANPSDPPADRPLLGKRATTLWSRDGKTVFPNPGGIVLVRGLGGRWRGQGGCCTADLPARYDHYV
jgi:hypothetical protein